LRGAAWSTRLATMDKSGEERIKKNGEQRTERRRDGSEDPPLQKSRKENRKSGEKNREQNGSEDHPLQFGKGEGKADRLLRERRAMRDDGDRFEADGG
jgi:hypothetical protein